MQELCSEINTAEYFAFDTETTGLDIVKDKPIGISFATSPGKAYYVPLVQEQLGESLSLEEVTSKLSIPLQDKTKLKIAHNLKFDLQMLENLQLPVAPPYGDTMLEAFLLSSTETSYKLDRLCKTVFDVDKTPIESLLGKKKQGSMLEVELNTISDYACEDADYCLRLHEHYHPKMNAEGRWIEKTIDNNSSEIAFHSLGSISSNLYLPGR